jgi:hypothetical protein
VARLSLPAELSGPGLEEEQVRLLDLSPAGARIEHCRPLPNWALCFLFLPPALGGVRLQGEAVWSRMVGQKQVAEGKRLVYYQSGVAFRWLTAAQRTALTAALQLLRAAQESRDTAPPA